MTTFNAWIDTFIEEKGIDLDQCFDVEGVSGTNVMPYGVVVEHIKLTSGAERRSIKTMIVKIDFMNGDVCHFFRHLGQALAI